MNMTQEEFKERKDKVIRDLQALICECELVRLRAKEALRVAENIETIDDAISFDAEYATHLDDNLEYITL